MASLASARLSGERKKWRKSRPHGFVAKPAKKADGSTNLFVWECSVPGQAGTPWEGCDYNLLMTFPHDYPSSPPDVKFVPPLFHPNVYQSGKICLSIINPDADWTASTSVSQILLGVQELLTEPNIKDPANGPASHLLSTSPEKYKQAIIEQAKRYPHIQSVGAQYADCDLGDGVYEVGEEGEEEEEDY